MTELGERCGAVLPAQVTALGGAVEVEQTAGSSGRYRARVLLWRTDRLREGVRSYFRYERIDQPCPSQHCDDKLVPLVVTWMGQLLEETVPSELPAASLELGSRCVATSSGPVAPVASQLRCPFVLPQSVLPRGTAPTSRSPLQKSLGGAAIAGGVILLGAGLLMTANDYASLTLRTSETCPTLRSPIGKCYATDGGIGASWGLGAGLLTGGVLILLDPLQLFARPRNPN